MRDERGFALVLTLVVTALMVALTAELMYQVSVDTSLSRSFRDGQQASLLAESGITGAMKLLQVSLASQGYSSPSLLAKPFAWEDEIGSIAVNIADENGKICLNGLVLPNGTVDDFTMNALKRLGQRLQIPDDCWNALADWLDSDDQPRPGGAETSYYKTLNPPYAAHNAKLATLSELSLVKGFTPDIIARLRPFVTIYFDQPNAPLANITINTAPLEVLTALDSRIDDSMANRIIEARNLQPFTSPGDLSRVDGQIAAALTGRVIVKGTVFRVTSVAKVGDAARTVEAVVMVTVGLPAILSWQEY
ncbi:MAG TPA: type II secretion system minor pseudopilin GspK [Geobacteraceae bacterium]